MNEMTTLLAKDERFTFGDAEILSDYRQRRAPALNSVDLRIRAWEKVHGLRMPSDPKHPALQAIAAATQLALADVLNEQGLRSARRASAGT